MRNVKRPQPFVLVSTNHGSMITNRNDFCITGNEWFGVGLQLFEQGCYDPKEVELLLDILDIRRHFFGDGVVALDCGANIGVHSVEWGRWMYGWGRVFAFEAQERIYYALAGNLAINNCFNVSAFHVALGAGCGSINIPEPNYFVPGSFGSFELVKREETEFIGQAIDYAKTVPVSLVSLDSLGLDRVDFIKIDVEGMELDVLKGAASVIEKNHPVMFIEIIKSDQDQLTAYLTDRGYKLFPHGGNVLAIHQADPCCQRIMEGK